MLLTIAPQFPFGSGASRAVWAMSLTQELFLGFTTSTSDDPRVLVAEQLGSMGEARTSAYLRLSESADSLTIEARSVPRGDRWAYQAANRNFRDENGDPKVGAL